MLKAYEGVLVVDVISASDLRVADVRRGGGTRSLKQERGVGTLILTTLSESLNPVFDPHLLFHTFLRQVTGSSDPYAVLSVGPSSAQTGFVMKTVNPRWDPRRS
jgi:hypothetical protein